MIETVALWQMLSGSVLASLAVGIAFGPELFRSFTRWRDRELPSVGGAKPSA